MTHRARQIMTIGWTAFFTFAWPLSSALRGVDVIGEFIQINVVILALFAFAVYQIYVLLPEQVGRGAVESQTPVIESYLERFVFRYYRILGEIRSDPADIKPLVRTNIMLPTFGKNRSSIPYLRIYYVHCAPSTAYRSEEFALHWEQDQGTCGCVFWKDQKHCIYDSKYEDYRGPSQKLSYEQKKVTSKINSALSVPIWNKSRSKLIGVLNLDSKQSLERTQFLHHKVIDAVTLCADHLAPFCPIDGVAEHKEAQL